MHIDTLSYIDIGRTLGINNGSGRDTSGAGRHRQSCGKGRLGGVYSGDTELPAGEEGGGWDLTTTEVVLLELVTNMHSSRSSGRFGPRAARAAARGEAHEQWGIAL